MARPGLLKKKGIGKSDPEGGGGDKKTIRSNCSKKKGEKGPKKGPFTGVSLPEKKDHRQRQEEIVLEKENVQKRGRLILKHGSSEAG